MTSVVTFRRWTDARTARAVRRCGQQTYDEPPNPLLSLGATFSRAAAAGSVRRPRCCRRGLRNGPLVEAAAGMHAAQQSHGNRFLSGDARPRPTKAWTESHARCWATQPRCPLRSIRGRCCWRRLSPATLRDLDAFAEELRRVAGSGGRIYLRSCIPKRRVTCDWKRGFRNGRHQYRAGQLSRYSLSQVICQSFAAHGLEVTCLAGARVRRCRAGDLPACRQD